MARRPTPHPDPIVRDLEAIRGLSWSRPEEFDGVVGLISDPAIVHLARGSKNTAVRVRTLRRALTTVANRIERHEKQHPPPLNRSDAFAARVLLRLALKYDEMAVESLQDAVAAVWQKHDGSAGTTRLKTGGFRKQQQPRLYERLALAVHAYLSEVHDRLPVKPEDSSLPVTDPRLRMAALWTDLTASVLRNKGTAITATADVLSTVRELDQLIHEHVLDVPTDPADVLAAAMFTYARELHDSGRDSALLSFRSNVSLTLHIIGQHHVRVEVGALALDAATVLANALAQAEILVDDLGWGQYMCSEPDLALESIASGERIAHSTLASGAAHESELTITIAKASRHRAIIEAEQHGADTLHCLSSALELLQGLDGSVEVVRREIAQIFHARALVMAIQWGVNDKGAIAGHDHDAEHALAQALANVREAAEIFRDLGDQARYTKALFLEVRLLEASGNTLEARQVRVIRDRALAASDWSRPDRVTTLVRV